MPTRRTRLLAAFAVLSLVGTGPVAAQLPPLAEMVRPEIDIAADPSRRDRWRLPSVGRWLGGLSGLSPLPDEGAVRRFLALSDRGWLVELRLDAALVAVPVGRVDRGVGRGRDAEALIATADGDGWWIAFERDHRLHRVGADPAGTVVQTVRLPGVAQLTANAGVEALARLADGSLLAIAEGGAGGTVPVWHLAADGTLLAQSRLPVGDGFRPVDAIGLPDGGFLLLERRYLPILGFASRLRLWPPAFRAALAAGAPLSYGQPVVAVGRLPPANWEGMALTADRGRPDRAILTLVSDDNFSGDGHTQVLRRPAPFVNFSQTAE